MSKEKEKSDSVRITIDRELFEIIMEQVLRMNDVCHGVLNIKIEQNNKIFRDASKIIAKKFKGEI